MGTDKATLEVDGRPLAARAIDALRGAGLDVVTVGAERGAGAALAGTEGTDVIPDDLPGIGPLAAVATSLRDTARRGFATAVILACDLPRMETTAVRTLLEASPGADLLVGTDTGEPAWPNGRWSVTLLARIDAAVAAGERGFRSFSSDAATVELGSAIRDVDRPEDLSGHPVRWPG